MVPRTRRTRRGTITECYYCSARALHATCEMPYIPRATVDDAVYAYFGGLGLDLAATKEQLAAASEHKRAEARSLLCAAEREAREAQERLVRIKRDYASGEINAAEWRELRGELEPEADTAEAEVKRLRAQLEAEEGEAARSQVEADLLSSLADIRAELTEEVRDAEGAAAVRAVLMRLFDGFVLHRSLPGEEISEPNKVQPWIEPLLSEPTLAGFEKKLRPAIGRKSPGKAQNNLSAPMKLLLSSMSAITRKGADTRRQEVVVGDGLSRWGRR